MQSDNWFRKFRAIASSVRLHPADSCSSNPAYYHLLVRPLLKAVCNPEDERSFCSYQGIHQSINLWHLKRITYSRVNDTHSLMSRQHKDAVPLKRKNFSRRPYLYYKHILHNPYTQ